MANYKEIVKDTTITFRIESADKDKLQQIVKKQGYKSLSALMGEMVQEYLSKNFCTNGQKLLKN